MKRKMAAALMSILMLAGCGTVASLPAATEAVLPQPTAAPTATAAPIPVEPTPLPTAVAEKAAMDYWAGELAAAGHRYESATVYGTKVVDPATCDTLPAQEYPAGTQLVQVDYSIQYSPEYLILGPQFSDGDTSYLLAAMPDGTVQGGLAMPWQMENGETPAAPPPSAEAAALGLTQRQYLWLTHQTAALTAAGVTDFSGEPDWTDAQLCRYLAARGHYLIPAEAETQPDCWLSSKDYEPCAQQLALVRLADFSDTAELWNGTDTAGDWPLFTAEECARYLGESSAPEVIWAYSREADGTILATGHLGGKPQQYTFSICDGGEGSPASRTCCTGGQSA